MWSRSMTISITRAVFVLQAAFAQEVAALMVPLGCEVEPNVHPTEGPVVRMRLVDTGSTLYKSGTGLHYPLHLLASSCYSD